MLLPFFLKVGTSIKSLNLEDRGTGRKTAVREEECTDK